MITAEPKETRLSPQDRQKLKAVDAKVRERMRRQDEAAAEFYRRRDNSGVERLGTVIERLLSSNAELVRPREEAAIT